MDDVSMFSGGLGFLKALRLVGLQEKREVHEALFFGISPHEDPSIGSGKALHRRHLVRKPEARSSD